MTTTNGAGAGRPGRGGSESTPPRPEGPAPRASGDAPWTVVVPVKRFSAAKSRLSGSPAGPARSALARAFALDTTAVVAATPGVARVLLVTDEPAPAELLARRAGHRPREAPVGLVPGVVPAGLNPALRHAVAHARATGSRDLVVLAADLPALRVADLAEALAAARGVVLGVVADRDGTGTTLLSASGGALLVPRFGPGSAARHRTAGHVDLPLAPTTRLRLDVDRFPDLGEAVRLGVGPRCRAVLRASEGLAGSLSPVPVTGPARPRPGRSAPPRPGRS